MAHVTAKMLLSNQTENLIVRDLIHLKVRLNISPQRTGTLAQTPRPALNMDSDTRANTIIDKRVLFDGGRNPRGFV
jgi:hypothetical protein